MEDTARNPEDFDEFETALLGELPGENEVDRVITQDSAQVYRAKVVLALLDSPHYDFTDTNIVSSNPVPVFGYSSPDKIGFGAISLEDGEGKCPRLVADISIDYSTPERLEIETGRALFARAAGEWDGETADQDDGFVLDFYGGRRTVDEVRVAYIVLLPEAPKDDRVPAVGKPVF